MIGLLERFAKKLGLHDTQTLTDVEEYIAWQIEHHPDFSPSPLDDVDLRTYFLELRVSGRQRPSQSTTWRAKLLPSNVFTIGLRTPA